MVLFLHLVLLAWGVLMICREIFRYLRARQGRPLPELESPRPNLIRLSIESGVFVVVAALLFAVNMSCFLGCLNPGPQRVLDLVSLLLVVGFAYYALAWAGAIYWHLRRCFRRRPRYPVAEG